MGYRNADIAGQIKEAESAASELSEKKSQVDSLFDIKKVRVASCGGLCVERDAQGRVPVLEQLYEAENIREIQESEEESNQPAPKAADEGGEQILSVFAAIARSSSPSCARLSFCPCVGVDIEEYFEIEEEERRKEEQTAWSWDDMMRRIEELEAREEGGGAGDEHEEKAPADGSSSAAAELKAKGNSAFAKRKFAESVSLYSQALELEPSSHVCAAVRGCCCCRQQEIGPADLSARID